MQRRLAIIVDSIDDCAATYQQRSDASAIVERCSMKSSAANVRRSVHIGAAIEQQLDDVDMAVLRCAMQRSAAILLLDAVPQSFCLESILAPLSSRQRTTSTRFLNAADINGVWPFTAARSMSAPRLTSSSTTAR